MVNYIETPNEKELLAMREKYKAGTRVCLMKMDDTYAPPIGTCGTVSYVDDSVNLRSPSPDVDGVSDSPYTSSNLRTDGQPEVGRGLPSIDDTGSIFVNWDNGSTLALVYGVDKCEVVSNTKRVQGKKIPQKISRNTLFKSEA